MGQQFSNNKYFETDDQESSNNKHFKTNHVILHPKSCHQI